MKKNYKKNWVMKMNKMTKKKENKMKNKNKMNKIKSGKIKTKITKEINR